MPSLRSLVKPYPDGAIIWECARLVYGNPEAQLEDAAGAQTRSYKPLALSLFCSFYLNIVLGGRNPHKISAN